MEEHVAKWHQYPKAKGYITVTLYPTCELWAAAYTKQCFTVGLQSTSRVEGSNALVKKFVDSSFTLVQLFHGLQEVLKEEERRVRYEQWVETLPEADEESLMVGIFPEISEVLAKYLPAPILKLQQSCIKRSFYYCVEKIDDINSIIDEVCISKRLIM
jgi:hypothetical protein